MSNRTQDFDQAAEYAARMHRRQNRGTIAVRNAFFDVRERDENHKDQSSVPPITQLLKSRSAQGLDIKLALTYLWMAGGSGEDRETGERHTVQFNDEDIAKLLALPDPSNAGKRRIAKAKVRLEAASLIDVRRRPGKTSVVALLDESGNGEPYVPPGDLEAGGTGKYSNLPRHFWTNLWLMRLNGNALAALLIINQLSTEPRKAVWRTPRERESRHGFSQDTWYDGTDLLHRYGLVSLQRKSVREPFETTARYFRDSFILNPAKLRETAPEALPDILVSRSKRLQRKRQESHINRMIQDVIPDVEPF